MPRTPNTYGRYIERRGSRFFAVMKVPVDVRQKLGRTRFIQALGTDSPAEARRRVLRLIAAWQSEIAKARQDGTDPLAEDAAWWHRTLQKARTKKARREVLAAIDLEAENLSTPTYTDNPNQTDIEAVEASAHALGQDFHDRATGKIVGFTDHLDDWLAKWDTTDKTKDMARSIVKEFAKRFPTVQDVTHDEVQRWVDGLELAPATVRRSLSNLRGYWKYLQRADVRAVSKDVLPLADLDLPKNRNGKKDQRKPFAPKDVVKLLILAHGGGDRQLFNLIRLGMWTGCRIEELCSLKTEDVYINAPIPYIQIEDAKTPAGWRQVPIHDALKKPLKKMIDGSDDGYVLSGLTTNKYGDRSNAIGKRFGRLKTARGFGPEYVFHSIRRTVATQLENAGVPEGVAADIIGHDKPSMTYGLYSGGASLAVKAEALAKLRY